MIDLMKIACIIAVITFFLALITLDYVDERISKAVDEKQIKHLGVVKFILTIIVFTALVIILMNIGYLSYLGVTSLFIKL